MVWGISVDSIIRSLFDPQGKAKDELPPSFSYWRSTESQRSAPSLLLYWLQSGRTVIRSLRSRSTVIRCWLVAYLKLLWRNYCTYRRIISY